MRRKPKNRFGTIIGTMIGIMIIGSVFWASRNYPGYKVNAYINAINTQDFEEAYALTYQDAYFAHISKEEYINFLQTYFNRNNFVKLEKGKQLEDGQAYNVTYIFKEQVFNQILGVKQHKGEWYVQNPFSMEAIAEVNREQPDRINISVSEVNQQDKVQQETIGEQSQSSNNQHANADKETIDEQKESIESFVGRFYKDYTRGIEEKDNLFLEEYVSNESLDQVEDDYEAWYITGKDVVDAKVRIELEHIEEQDNGNVEIELVEVVQLTNLEKIEGQDTEKLYKVVTSWKIEMESYGNSYKISEKNLKESVISYQDDNKQWIAY